MNACDLSEGCLRQKLGCSLALVLCLSTCANAGTPAAEEASVTSGGEHGDGHGHHGHGHHGHAAGGSDCHGSGSHGDFSDAECFARMFDAPERDAWQRPDEVVTFLGIAPAMTVADLGAGTGYFESRLSAAVSPSGHVLALDVAPEMVAYMQERFAREGLTNVEARQVASDSVGLSPESVDRVLCVDTWHHVEDRVTYATQLRGALRPGGSLLIVDFTLDSPEGPPVEMRLSADSVLLELAAAGLTAELVSESLPHQWIVRGAR